MSTTNFDAGKPVERSIENHSREKERRLQWIADDIAEIAASVKRALFDNVVCTARMDENEYAQFLNFGPERIVLCRRRHLTTGMSGDADATQPQFFDSLIELLRRHLRMLQRDRR